MGSLNSLCLIHIISTSVILGGYGIYNNLYRPAKRITKVP